MDDLDEQLLALAGDSSPKIKKRKRIARYLRMNASHFQIRKQDSGSEESDAGMDEASSWGPDLMGDSKDRAM